MVEMQVHGIGIDARWSQPLVLLQEAAGRGRILPIWMAEMDAAAVVAARSGSAPVRPDTHTLIGTVIGALGRTLTGVVITEVRGSVFHAVLVLDGGLRIDSRASDAIALALRTGIEIEATEAVLERAGVPPDAVHTADQEVPVTDGVDSPEAVESPEASVSEDEVERFRRMLDDASPSDFEQD